MLLQPLTGAVADQELSWVAQSSGVLARLSSVFFVDRERGWAVGSNGTLLATEDGGKQWRRAPVPERQRKEALRDVWLFKDERGCLLGEYGLVNRGGGVNWSERVFLLFSADRGANWSAGELARQPIKQPEVIQTTIDKSQGKDQTKDVVQVVVAKRPPDPVLVRLFFVDEKTGWACGEGGTIQATKDGGLTWALQNTLARKLLYDVTAVDEKQAWIVGASGVVLRTIDGGQQWSEQPSGVTVTLRAVQFIDAKRGWAAGAGGAIIATTDGGSRWQTQKSNTTSNLNDVFFVNAREGWAAGDNGTMLHTVDGGETWEESLLDTHGNLSRLFFVAPDCGWVVGTNGAIYKYGHK